MFDRLQRSFELCRLSFGMILRDRSLLVFPLVGGLCVALLAVSFAWAWLPAGQSWSKAAKMIRDGEVGTNGYVALFFFYLINFIVLNVVNAAMAITALAHLDGRPLRVRQALGAAMHRLPSLAAYSAISATIGLLFQAAEQRLGIVGKIAAALLGASWSMASFIALPAMIAENLGPASAIARSLKLLRRCWGEGLIASVGLELMLSFSCMATWCVAFALMFLNPWLGLAFGGIVCLGLCVLYATLDMVFRVALYRYAVDGDAGHYGQDFMVAAFATR